MRFLSFRNNAHSCFRFLLILGIKSSFPFENKKTTGKILQALFLSFLGAKIGQNCLSKPFKKSHKVFVLTCGYVGNCRVWGNKKHRIATMFLVIHSNVYFKSKRNFSQSFTQYRIFLRPFCRMICPSASNFSFCASMPFGYFSLSSPLAFNVLQ